MKVFVHKYSYRHAKKRAKYKKLFRAGKVTKEHVWKGWLYTHKE